MVVKKFNVGVRYLTQKDITEGLEAVINGKGYTELATFKRGDKEEQKEVAGVPLSVNGEDHLWTPGKNALNLLIDELGEDETSWIGKKVVFRTEIVKTKTGPTAYMAARPAQKVLPQSGAG